MPDQQDSQQSQSADQGQQSHQQSQQQPASQPAQQQPSQQLDTASYAQLQRGIGEQKALEQIKSIFGTADLEQLKALAAKTKEPDNKNQQQSDEVVRRIQELENTIKEKEELHRTEIQRTRLATELSKYGPKVPDLILQHFQSNYEVRQIDGKDIVYKKGATLPEQVGSEIATVSVFFENMARKSDLSGLFNQAQTTGTHVDTSGANYVDEANTPVTPEQMKDNAFLDSVERAGEMTRLISTGRVDMRKVKGYIKK